MRDKPNQHQQLATKQNEAWHRPPRKHLFGKACSTHLVAQPQKRRSVRTGCKYLSTGTPPRMSSGACLRPLSSRTGSRNAHRLAVDHPTQERAHQNVEVESHRPVFDVPEVAGNALRDARIASKAPDLRPARHTGPHTVLEHVPRYRSAILLHIKRQFGTWPHQAHRACKHVEELRQLVEAVLTDEHAEARAPGVVIARPGGRLLAARAHAAKLEHGEGLAPIPHALLAKENRPGTREPYPEGQNEQQRAQHHNAHSTCHHVKQALAQRPSHEVQPPLSRNQQTRRAHDVDVVANLGDSPYWRNQTVGNAVVRTQRNDVL